VPGSESHTGGELTGAPVLEPIVVLVVGSTEVVPLLVPTDSLALPVGVVVSDSLAEPELVGASPVVLVVGLVPLVVAVALSLVRPPSSPHALSTTQPQIHPSPSRCNIVIVSAW